MRNFTISVLVIPLLIIGCQEKVKENTHNSENVIVIYEQKDPCFKLFQYVFDTHVFQQYAAPDFLNEYLDLAIVNLKKCHCYRPNSSGFHIASRPYNENSSANRTTIVTEHQMFIGNYKQLTLENFFIYKHHVFVFYDTFLNYYKLRRIGEVTMTYIRQKGIFEGLYPVSLDLKVEGLQVDLEDISVCVE